ncbi:hypothetical protein B0H17DRAFT_1206699 [Mycena rosella]|uniref:F-box domain-containing protein n=1 Tax=Mycena rosella TaxID=1033263 RepID=A0AAD7G8Q9_MYCRO|nr:hypothetical protein B0H17DRAFT_1206699 [Mycena rosella]
MSASTLEALGEDILIRILSSLDIYSTLCVSQLYVNHYLNDIGSVRQLWILHIQTLAHRNLIELPPSLVLADLSTASLLDLVKHVVTGPATWAAGVNLVFPPRLRYGRCWMTLNGSMQTAGPNCSMEDAICSSRLRRLLNFGTWLRSA